MFDCCVEGTEEIREVFFVERGDNIVGVACGGPLFCEVFECGFGFARNEDRCCGFEEALKEGVVGEGLVCDDEVEVDRFEEGDGFDDVLGGVDGAGGAGEIADAFGVFPVFVQDKDVYLVGGILSFFVFFWNAFVLQELIPRQQTLGDNTWGTNSGLAPYHYIIFYPSKVKLFFKIRGLSPISRGGKNRGLSLIFWPSLKSHE